MNKVDIHGKSKLSAIHKYMYGILKKPKKCQDCNKVKRLDLANISQKYKRDITDWEWLCRRCHMKKDGRLKKLIKRNISGILKKKRCAWCKKWFKPWNRNSTSCSRSCNAYLANNKRWGYKK